MEGYSAGRAMQLRWVWVAYTYNPLTSISYTRLEALVTTYGTPRPVQMQLSSVQNHVPSLKIGWLIPD